MDERSGSNDRRSRGPRLGAALALALLPACATILDFQDPIAREDLASPTDAGSAAEAGSTSSAPPPSTVLDAAEAPPPGEAGPCGCATVPEGWRGPLRAFETAGAASPCAGTFGTFDSDAWREPGGDPAVCSCSCSAPSGGSCSASASYFADGSCATSCGVAGTVDTCSRPATTTGICATLGGARITATASGGACAPQTGKTVPPVRYAGRVRLCGASTTTDCTALCDPDACIAAPGVLACPAAFPVAHLYHAGADDTRACSACTCGAATGQTCAGTVTTYANGGCSPATGTAALGTCVPMGSVSRLSVSGTTASGGTCAPAGGAPVGDVVGAGPTTVCCAR